MIKDLKELERLFKLCRKHGVDEFEHGDLRLKFGDAPVRRSSQSQGGDEIENEELTEEDMVFLSAQP